MSWKRAIQDWNMKYVDTETSPGSGIRVFTSSERTGESLEDQRRWRSWRVGDEDRDECPENCTIGEEEGDGCSKKLNKLEFWENW